MAPNASTKPNQRKRRSADSTPPPPRRQPPRLLPGSPKARWGVNGNVTNAADLSEATLALAQGMPRVLPTMPAPGQLVIPTRGEHVDRPHVATNVQSGRRAAPRNDVRSQRYAPYSRAPPTHFAAHLGAEYAPPADTAPPPSFSARPGAGYTSHAVPAPASRMNFVQPQQQYQQYQHYPQHQFGNAFPETDLMRFPSNSSQGTLGHGISNAVGHQPSSNNFDEDALRAEDFEEAGLNLDAVQSEALNLSWDMAPVGPANGWYTLDQMASRPIFYQMEPPISAPPPTPAPAAIYQPHGHYGVPDQRPLPEPTFANYIPAGTYQSPYAPIMYAPQHAHFHPQQQPQPMYAPGSINNIVIPQPGSMYAQNLVNNFPPQQHQPTMYAQPYQRQPTAQQPQANYPVADYNPPAAYAGPSSRQPGNYNGSTGQAQQLDAGSRRRRSSLYLTTEEWVEAQRRQHPSGE
ncbi:hypothetical protein J4E90_010845 [Alternaria incomplexa]|uniref:uncharacterized protein n=1 Tax=Alternaria incomplexa TaxID=1187928 RepID=UPI00221F1940|nr:uncharacterized protein J4E90_010845 [Alternaria incomplexa]KAI4906172.1 hypothetical protein J4E90_010845 [Alternaria incomplexa]